MATWQGKAARAIALVHADLGHQLQQHTQQDDRLLLPIGSPDPTDVSNECRLVRGDLDIKEPRFVTGESDIFPKKLISMACLKSRPDSSLDLTPLFRRKKKLIAGGGRGRGGAGGVGGGGSGGCKVGLVASGGGKRRKKFSVPLHREKTMADAQHVLEPDNRLLRSTSKVRSTESPSLSCAAAARKRSLSSAPPARSCKSTTRTLRALSSTPRSASCQHAGGFFALSSTPRSASRQHAGFHDAARNEPLMKETDSRSAVRAKRKRLIATGATPLPHLGFRATSLPHSPLTLSQPAVAKFRLAMKPRSSSVSSTLL
jgi:hypothetical protein